MGNACSWWMDWNTFLYIYMYSCMPSVFCGRFAVFYVFKNLFHVAHILKDSAGGSASSVFTSFFMHGRVGVWIARTLFALCDICYHRHHFSSCFSDVHIPSMLYFPAPPAYYYHLLAWFADCTSLGQPLSACSWGLAGHLFSSFGAVVLPRRCLQQHSWVAIVTGSSGSPSPPMTDGLWDSALQLISQTYSLNTSY